ncbi:LAFE_0B02256g1_1 [Lachancea fermentati]|uniref:LAFE_0B02256g1_1 n=1 Tax=Lachancea fermentati TaxID=4955 RepID=A0A1G4M7G4_LACFM|nr:LAFE_0B02256g1_1 [Lachancea fermentati]
MVLWHKNSHSYDKDFCTVTLAFFNRYPNPYSTHVLSIDTLAREVDSHGQLRSTRLIKKTGRLPRWVRPFLGRISQSWILEDSRVDARHQTLHAYTRNLDHTQIIQVEEYTTYRFDGATGATRVASRVKFSSGFHAGIRQRIEQWSMAKFGENIHTSRMGMAYVIARLEDVSSAARQRPRM